MLLEKRHWANFLCLVVLIALVISLLERSWFLAETLALLRPQLASVLIGLALFFGWRKRWKWVWAAGAGALLGLLIFVPDWTQTAPGARVEEGQPVLKVFCHNVQFDTENQDKVIATIKELQPDIVILLEVTSSWEQPLKALEPFYGADLFEYRADPFGIAFFTKLPVKSSQLEDFSGYELLSTLSTLEFAGQDITVIGTHPPPPVANTLAKVSDWYLEKLATDVSRMREPVIVMGDFNIAPGMHNYGRFLKTGDLKSAGKPWAATWTAFKIPLLGVRMDHHFLSRQWKVKSTKVGGFNGSDHRWVLSELVLEESD